VYYILVPRVDGYGTYVGKETITQSERTELPRISDHVKELSGG
jgi:hypothetical protein